MQRHTTGQGAEEIGQCLTLNGTSFSNPAPTKAPGTSQKKGWKMKRQRIDCYETPSSGHDKCISLMNSPYLFTQDQPAKLQYTQGRSLYPLTEELLAGHRC